MKNYIFLVLLVVGFAFADDSSYGRYSGDKIDTTTHKQINRLKGNFEFGASTWAHSDSWSPTIIIYGSGTIMGVVIIGSTTYADNAGLLSGRPYNAFVTTIGAQNVSGIKTFFDKIVISGDWATDLDIIGLDRPAAIRLKVISPGDPEDFCKIIFISSIPAIGATQEYIGYNEDAFFRFKISTSIYILGYSSASEHYGGGEYLTDVDAETLDTYDSLYFATASTATDIHDNYARKDSSPTWTGIHTFNKQIILSGGGDIQQELSMNGQAISDPLLDTAKLDNNLNANEHKIINHSTSPTVNSDVSTKGYVDYMIKNATVTSGTDIVILKSSVTILQSSITVIQSDIAVLESSATANADNIDILLSTATDIHDNYARKDSSPTWTGKPLFENMVNISSKTKITVTSGGVLEAGKSDCSASGLFSVALGEGTSANGWASTALGYETTTDNQASTAMGHQTIASAAASTAMGSLTIASGLYSTAMGKETIASGLYSFAAGVKSSAAAQGVFAISDSEDAYFIVDVQDQFGARFAGGYKITGGSVTISSHTKMGGNLDMSDNKITNVSTSPVNADDVSTKGYTDYVLKNATGIISGNYAVYNATAIYNTDLKKGTNTWTGGQDWQATSTITILHVTTIRWADGTVQISSPPVGGDVYLASTQTFTGGNDFQGSSTMTILYISTVSAKGASGLSFALANGIEHIGICDDKTTLKSSTVAVLGYLDSKQAIKGWVRFNGSVDPPTINDSYNVASVADSSGAGHYIITWSIPFSDDDYCVTLCSNGESSYIQTMSTGSVTIYTADAAGTATNRSIVTAMAVE